MPQVVAFAAPEVHMGEYVLGKNEGAGSIPAGGSILISWIVSPRNLSEKGNKTTMKNKKNGESKVEQRAVYLESGMSLADVLAKVMADGVTDLSTVKYYGDFVGCCGGHAEGEYCYCPSSYTDIRFEYEVKV